MRIRNALRISIAILLGFAAACNSDQQDNLRLDEARKAISESNEIYFQSFVKGDSSLFIERYAKDCCIMPPGAPEIS